MRTQPLCGRESARLWKWRSAHFTDESGESRLPYPGMLTVDAKMFVTRRTE